MKILMIKITLRASYVHSLKEKRMIVKSLVQKLRNKFNISVSEVDMQDFHQTIVIGISEICGTSAIADSSFEKIVDFIEDNTDAEIVNIERDIDTF